LESVQFSREHSRAMVEQTNAARQFDLRRDRPLGRRCFGLEIDPVYVDAVVRRWQAFTRDDARHVSSGRWFRA
jgi:hypothetical protein